MSRVYVPRKGYETIVTSAQAQRLGEAMERIEAEKGRPVKPEDVVEDSRTIDSPFHSFIEWDDRKAAKMHRIDQARTIIRSISVELPEYGNAVVRAYLPVGVGRGNSGYMATSDALVNRPDIIQAHMAKLRDEAVRISETYGGWYKLVNGPAREFIGAAREVASEKVSV